MAEINVVSEIVDKHSTDEVISYLSKLMNGVVRNFRTGVEEDSMAIIWASTGDIAQCAAILKAMDGKIKERQSLMKN